MKMYNWKCKWKINNINVLCQTVYLQYQDVIHKQVFGKNLKETTAAQHWLLSSLDLLHLDKTWKVHEKCWHLTTWYQNAFGRKKL